MLKSPSTSNGSEQHVLSEMITFLRSSSDPLLEDLLLGALQYHHQRIEHLIIDNISIVSLTI